MTTRTRAFHWAVSTLPLAPVAVLVYLFFAWLFIITKPSPTGGLPFAAQLGVLVKSPLPIWLPAVSIQAAASILAMLGYPRLRWVAVVPAAVVMGVLLFIMLDNFTYTIFRFGVLKAGPVARPLYAGLLFVLMVLAGARILEVVSGAIGYRGVRRTALMLMVLMSGGSVVASARKATAPPPPSDWLPKREPGAAPGARPNIFFLGIDGVDAPRLSAYGYARSTSPFLEEFRQESLFFENAFSNVGRTHGSLVSLLTGRLPFSDHVTFPPTVLQGEDAHRHLPAILKELGYTSLQLGMRHYADAEDANLLGFDAANYRWEGAAADRDRSHASQDETATFRGIVAERLDERLGHLFGFRHFIDGYGHVEGNVTLSYWSDDRRVATLVDFFKNAEEPWFVHAHLLDTHCCAYHPRQLYFTDDGESGSAVRDSELKETDQHIRRLIDALKYTGRLDRTVVVISSDHTSEWTTTGRVPLMIRFPNARPRGHVMSNAQLADVVPTMLAYLGLGTPDWMDGRPLVPPTKIDANRAIFGVSAVAARVTAPPLTFLPLNGPPNYGAASATMIVGNRWFELSLIDGTMRSGLVRGHTARSPVVPDDEKARAMLQARLTSSGFQIETAQGGQ